MAKFIFLCRRCGKKFKEHGRTLQSARDSLCCKQGGIIMNADQGFVCGQCAKDQYKEWALIDRGTIVEEDDQFHYVLF